MRERDLSHVAFSREDAASDACDARRTPLSEDQLYNTIIAGSVSSRLAIATHFFSCVQKHANGRASARKWNFDESARSYSLLDDPNGTESAPWCSLR